MKTKKKIRSFRRQFSYKNHRTNTRKYGGMKETEYNYFYYPLLLDTEARKRHEENQKAVNYPPDNRIRKHFVSRKREFYSDIDDIMEDIENHFYNINYPFIKTNKDQDPKDYPKPHYNKRIQLRSDLGETRDTHIYLNKRNDNIEDAKINYYTRDDILYNDPNNFWQNISNEMEEAMMRMFAQENANNGINNERFFMALPLQEPHYNKRVRVRKTKFSNP